jgi:hypothetical protein
VFRNGAGPKGAEGLVRGGLGGRESHEDQRLAVAREARLEEVPALGLALQGLGFEVWALRFRV